LIIILTLYSHGYRGVVTYEQALVSLKLEKLARGAARESAALVQHQAVRGVVTYPGESRSRGGHVVM